MARPAPCSARRPAPLPALLSPSKKKQVADEELDGLEEEDREELLMVAGFLQDELYGEHAGARRHALAHLRHTHFWHKL